MPQIRSEASIRLAKTKLRAQIRTNRRLLHDNSTSHSWSRRAAAIASQVLELEPVRQACAQRASIALYESRRTEPPTEALIERLEQAGAIPLAPDTAKRHQLDWRRPSSASSQNTPTHQDDPPYRGAAGLVALNCQVVLLPALAVGRDLTRLGQGGGYFDRLLARLRALAELTPSGIAPVFIALVGPGEVFDTIPTDDLDQPVDLWICG